MRSSVLLLSSSLVSLTSSFRSMLSILVVSVFLAQSLSAQQPIDAGASVDTTGFFMKGASLKKFDAFLPDQRKKNRQWFVGTLNVAGYGGSLIILNNTWYKNYPRSSFHTFNDDGEWLQVDKFGHAWTAYNAGKA